MFSQEYVMLGVVVSLEEMPAKKILICNKAERVASLAELIRSIVFTRVLPKPLAAEVRGKIQFAAGQVHGRLAVVTCVHYLITSLSLTPLMFQMICALACKAS